jgi:hypothetical protein
VSDLYAINAGAGPLAGASGLTVLRTPAEGTRPDFIDYLRLLARFGFTREQVDAMPAERIATLLSTADKENE